MREQLRYTFPLLLLAVLLTPAGSWAQKATNFSPQPIIVELMKKAQASYADLEAQRQRFDQLQRSGTSQDW